MTPYTEHYASALRLRMLLLYALNGFDMAFTKFLLGTGKFREVNPLMAFAMQNDWAAFMLKLILPVLLMVYLDSRLKYAEQRHIRYSVTAFNLLIGLYGAVGIMHLLLFVISK